MGGRVGPTIVPIRLGRVQFRELPQITYQIIWWVPGWFQIGLGKGQTLKELRKAYRPLKELFKGS